MSRRATVVILATLDTKGEEAAFLAEIFERQGFASRLLDLGLLEPPQITPHITRDEVARAARSSVAELVKSSKAIAMSRMSEGAGTLLKNLHSQEGVAGVIGIGGNQGAAMACSAMQVLPLGVPKVMVSTVVSGDIRPYIKAKDIAMFFSVGDILGGPNPITRSVLSQAAAALVGMMTWGEGLEIPQGPPVVAITALGNTHPAVTRCVDRLKDYGYRVVPFHASGACGSAMEELIEEGKIDGVLDLTPHELVGDVLGADIYRPVRPGRLLAAARQGIPQVISTGGLDYYCFGPEETILPHLRDRTVYMHNPLNANVMLAEEELILLAEVMAERLNQSKGPVKVVLPRLGWSIYGSEGGPFWNPQGMAIFTERLKAALEPKVEVLELDAHINNPAFADTCANLLHTMLQE
ncbi:MAG: Tm-1-like ATP-binding domain-containing protein [Thermosphaera sp.]